MLIIPRCSLLRMIFVHDRMLSMSPMTLITLYLFPNKMVMFRPLPTCTGNRSRDAGSVKMRSLTAVRRITAVEHYKAV